MLTTKLPVLNKEFVVDETTVLLILKEIAEDLSKNFSDCNYLWNYYRGDQPVFSREKNIRPEIKNILLENRALEITNFQVGYMCGEPIQYVSREGSDDYTEDVQRINDILFGHSKFALDKELFEWQLITGTGYRFLSSSENEEKDNLIIKTLSPTDTFVVHSAGFEKEVVLSGIVSVLDEETTLYEIYTDDTFFTIVDTTKDGETTTEVVSEPSSLGFNPIIEYPASTARLGCFEPVLTILDAINTVGSNRIDDVEQFVQHLMKFINCELDEKLYDDMILKGAVMIKSTGDSKGDVELLTSQLNQDTVQVLVDHLYDTVLSICGVPMKSGTGGGGDTGMAVMLRDGWSLTEARAKDREIEFKKPEQTFISNLLNLYNDIKTKTNHQFNVAMKYVDIKFTRRNYDNIQTKAQVLDTMLKNPKIHPKLAFEHSGLFPDADAAYLDSMKHYADALMEEIERLKEVEVLPPDDGEEPKGI